MPINLAEAARKRWNALRAASRLPEEEIQTIQLEYERIRETAKEALKDEEKYATEEQRRCRFNI